MDFRYLQISRSPSDEVLDILTHNIIGTPGHGMLYQHMGVSKKISQIKDPYFVNLVRAGHVVGTCCFCSRVTLNNHENIQSFYVRYFSFRDAFRRKSIKERVSGAQSNIRNEVESLLTGEALGVNSNEKFFFYAYVDPRNKRSALLCKEFGFETVRQYTSIIFSKINPKSDSLSSLEETVVDDSLKKQISEFYQHYTTLTFENLSGKKYYFIKNNDGQRVAGVHVNPDHWKIHSLPGIMGKIAVNYFKFIPLLNRLFNRNYHFVTFEGLCFIPGAEKYIEKLFESLLAKYGINSGICLVDASTPLYTTLKSLRLGPMNTLHKEVRGNVIIKFVNFTEKEKKEFYTNPSYLSTIDAT